jgi:aldehyde:ferredoxin oxidoreductase
VGGRYPPSGEVNGMKRRLLFINAAERRFWLETLNTEALEKDPWEEYFILSGESLCQYILRRRREALVMTRGPMAFLAGNKTTLGYVSPLTGLPHYSFVGGRGCAQLLNLGLDGIVFTSPTPDSLRSYLVLSGSAPDIEVEFKSGDRLPRGQRSAFYHLVATELNGQPQEGSVFTLGEGAYHGYRTANLAVEGIYHAGRGGAGLVFSQFASALVLQADDIPLEHFFVGDDSDFARDPNGTIAPLLTLHCRRFSKPDGGTIPKFFDTGASPSGQNTLPAWNARRLGYPAADLGSTSVLLATRKGRTGCHWCPVDCRHTHWVEADYAPGGHDTLLDDFEPTYSIFAMLGLLPEEDSLQGRLRLRTEVDRRVILPIEQMGCDIMDIGLALAALYEGLEQGLIPPQDVPPFLRGGQNLGSIDRTWQSVTLIREGTGYPALRAVANGPQALGERYPATQDLLFTCGRGTLGNAGHCNKLWTFLMPFSRFFGHYSGQVYKIAGEIRPGATREEAQALFRRVISEMLQREYFSVLCNSLSCCAFVFVIYTEDGQGVRVEPSGPLLAILRHYGIEASYRDLMWFVQAFWAQSMAFKLQCGWQPPSPDDYPRVVYEALSLALHQPPEELQRLMGLLIEEWKHQTRSVMGKFGHEPGW